jgi:hypothetical protein
VVGFGRWTPPLKHVHYKEITPRKNKIIERVMRAAYLFAGRYSNRIWEKAYWSVPYHREALKVLLQGSYDLIHANELNSLPVAIKVAKTTAAKVIFDAHEYSLGQKRRYGPSKAYRVGYLEYLLRRSLPKVDSFITVSNGISELYKDLLDIDSTVIMNAAITPRTSFRSIDPRNIKIIHHGGAFSGRGLENLIEMMPSLDDRFSLHFMLVDDNGSYIKKLRLLAESLSPGRVHFRSPVDPSNVVTTISEFDIGTYLLPPIVLNHEYALPNKFFDFIAAGLAIAIGPSPEMANIVRKYECGVISDCFSPVDLACRINRLSTEEINSMKRNSVVAAKELNADVEMAKLISIYKHLLER